VKGVMHFVHVDLTLDFDELIAFFAHSMIETLSEYLALETWLDGQEGDV
jgi:hypothetical protein